MFEIKIVLKSGYTGYFITNQKPENITVDAKKDLKDYIGNSIKDDLIGTIELTEKETGFETLINFREIALFAVKEIESEVK